MLNLVEVLNLLQNNQFSLATGVPCSYFKEFITQLEKSTKFHYIPATREDEAVGIACGYHFGGKKSFLLMQNSGFANIGDSLTSLAQLYKVPLLLFVSYRGLVPDADFPEHLIMGDISEDVLSAYQIPYWVVDEDTWQVQLKQAIMTMEASSLPVCLLVKEGVLSQ